MFSYIMVFSAGLLVDIFYALYIKSIQAGGRVTPAIYSVIIGLCSIAFVANVTESVLHAILWLLGLFFGTIIITYKSGKPAN